MATLEEKIARNPRHTAVCSNPSCDRNTNVLEFLWDHDCSVCGSLFVPTPTGLAQVADRIMKMVTLPYRDPHTGKPIPPAPKQFQGTDYIYPVRDRFPVTEEEARRR